MKVEESMTDRLVSGKLRHQVIGEVLMRPSDLRDQELLLMDLTEEDRKKRLLTEDHRRDMANVEVITHLVSDPAFMNIVEESRVKEIRETLPPDVLQHEILKLFE